LASFAEGRRVTRILLVENETLIREALRLLLGLEPTFDVVGDAADGEVALEMVEELRPDVILMDVRMPHLPGPEAVDLLRKRGDATPVILITTFDDDVAMLAGMRAGANGYLKKDVSLEQLREAIRAVLAGDTVFRPALSHQGLRRFRKLEPAFESADLPEALTPRENDVLRLMANGLSNREIGEVLGATEGTIKTHASTILGKLGVRDRTRAVLKALDLGLL
jgi:DNA-binding NarL/FixJ family response regulator